MSCRHSSFRSDAISYTPTVWTEAVTKLGPTNLNHLETGLQAAAAVADAAVAKPVAPVTNAGLVWSGSAWVAALLVNGNIDPAANIAYSKLTLAGSIVNNDVSAGAAVAYSKLSLTNSVARTDMAAGFKTTVGTMAAGPPGSPTTNDIWIATDVDANGTVWTFRYNSAEATYKWEFAGGTPVFVADTAGTNRQNANDATWEFITGMPSVTLARAGQYRWRFGGVSLQTTATNVHRIAVAKTSTPSTILRPSLDSQAGATGTDLKTQATTADDIQQSVTRSAADVVGLSLWSTAKSNVAMTYAWIEVIPSRII